MYKNKKYLPITLLLIGSLSLTNSCFPGIASGISFVSGFASLATNPTIIGAVGGLAAFQSLYTIRDNKIEKMVNTKFDIMEEKNTKFIGKIETFKTQLETIEQKLKDGNNKLKNLEQLLEDTKQKLPNLESNANKANKLYSALYQESTANLKKVEELKKEIAKITKIDANIEMSSLCFDAAVESLKIQVENIQSVYEDQFKQLVNINKRTDDWCKKAIQSVEDATAKVIMVDQKFDQNIKQIEGRIAYHLGKKDLQITQEENVQNLQDLKIQVVSLLADKAIQSITEEQVVKINTLLQERDLLKTTIKQLENTSRILNKRKQKSDLLFAELEKARYLQN